jgi:hypothetical protein
MEVDGADGADGAGGKYNMSEAVKVVRTCQNLLGQDGTCPGLLLLHVGPNCKGTTIRFLTSPILPRSPLVHMYVPHTSVPSPGTTLKGRRLSHSKADDFRIQSLTTFQKSTHQRSSTPRDPSTHTSAASDKPRMQWHWSAWHYGTLLHHVDTHSWEAWW